jgi:hypothetical protein
MGAAAAAAAAVDAVFGTAAACLGRVGGCMTLPAAAAATAAAAPVFGD